MVLPHFNRRRSVCVALLITATTAYHTSVLSMNKSSDVTRAVVALTAGVAGIFSLYKLGHWLFSTPDRTIYEEALANFKNISQKYSCKCDCWHGLIHPQQEVQPNTLPIQQTERIYPEIVDLNPVASAPPLVVEVNHTEKPYFESLNLSTDVEILENKLQNFANLCLPEPINSYLDQLSNNIGQLKKDRDELQKRANHLQQGTRTQDRELLEKINQLTQQIIDLDTHLEKFNEELSLHENFFVLHQFITKIFIKYKQEFHLLEQPQTQAATGLDPAQFYQVIVNTHPPLTKCVCIKYILTLEENKQKLQHFIPITKTYPIVNQAAKYCCYDSFAKIREMIEPYAKKEQTNLDQERHQEATLTIETRKAMAAEKEATARMKIANTREQRARLKESHRTTKRQIERDAWLAQQQQLKEIRQGQSSSNATLRQAAAALEQATSPRNTTTHEQSGECNIQ